MEIGAKDLKETDALYVYDKIKQKILQTSSSASRLIVSPFPAARLNKP